jgi:excisionase family DNA binding protein
MSLEQFPVNMRLDMVAAFLGVSDRTVRALIEEGSLAALPISPGGDRKRMHVRVPRESVQEFILLRRSASDLNPGNNGAYGASGNRSEAAQDGLRGVRVAAGPSKQPLNAVSIESGPVQSAVKTGFLRNSSKGAGRVGV